MHSTPAAPADPDHAFTPIAALAVPLPRSRPAPADRRLQRAAATSHRLAARQTGLPLDRAIAAPSLAAAAAVLGAPLTPADRAAIGDTMHALGFHRATRPAIHPDVPAALEIAVAAAVSADLAAVAGARCRAARGIPQPVYHGWAALAALAAHPSMPAADPELAALDAELGRLHYRAAVAAAADTAAYDPESAAAAHADLAAEAERVGTAYLRSISSRPPATRRIRDAAAESLNGLFLRTAKSFAHADLL